MLKWHRYEAAPVAGWIGYVEPADRAWTLFIAADGTSHLWVA